MLKTIYGLNLYFKNYDDMKKVYLFLIISIQCLFSMAQDAKPHFAAIHFSPVFESVKYLKTGFGTTLEGAYFLNDWFATGGIFRYSMHPYSYTHFVASGDASQFGFTANAFILKRFFNDKISLIPSVGLGFSSTTLPAGVYTNKELVQTAPGIFSEVETKTDLSAINVTSFVFNVFSVDCNYHFKPNMSAGVKFEYQIDVSNKWPSETLGDFLSFGIGYTYFFGVK